MNISISSVLMLVFCQSVASFTALGAATIKSAPKRSRKTCNKISICRLPITLSSSAFKMSLDESSKESEEVDPNNLMDMDIVLFSLKSDPESGMQLGAIQEDATLAPLSAWTTEYAFGETIEFLVHEDDRWLEKLEFDNVIIHSMLGEDVISYGSRQVGGGKGPGNPHGEESELLYYIENRALADGQVDIVLKPDLEILW
uniref:Uncharacterized protein n=1 Tax=Chaetoceros debilis TaxID=122233 RepID=A0A7S3PX91_9STRA|mmetsp:Transcript_5890/g.8655  ORF Transcript_5890/g.8655 Transcript_5890/m.8655 type:complete len:200 (+) Transcript_5890:144-743(+)